MMWPLVRLCVLAAAGATGALAGDGAELPPAAQGLAAAMAQMRAGHAGDAAAGFLQLAEAGDGRAQFNLALLFAEGAGVPQSAAEAAFWGWRARLAGVAQADVLLARLQPDLTPALRSAVAARLLAVLAAPIAAGDGRAMAGKSQILSDLLPDPEAEQAYVWMSLAAAFGTPGAAAARDAALAALPPEGRSTAQQAAIAAFHDWCGTADAGAVAACHLFP